MSVDIEFKEKVKKLYAEEGMIPREIALELDVKKDRISKCILRNFKDLKEQHILNRKNNNRKRIEKLYSECGLGAYAISKILKLNANTIKSYIERSCSHLKNQHLNSKKLRIESLKIINKEGSKLSPRQIVELYIQSYRYIDGKFVFDEKNRGKAPRDIPKVYCDYC